LARCPDQLTASAFNQLVQYANSPGNTNRAYCYAQFAIFSRVVTGSHNPLLVLILSTNRGMTMLRAWVGGSA